MQIALTPEVVIARNNRLGFAKLKRCSRTCRGLAKDFNLVLNRYGLR